MLGAAWLLSLSQLAIVPRRSRTTLCGIIETSALRTSATIDESIESRYGTGHDAGFNCRHDAV